MKPRRIQLSRRKGWRLPTGAVVVSRPRRFSSPYRLTDYRFENADGTVAPFDEDAARAMSLRDFEAALGLGALPFTVEDVRRELANKPLACWCPLSKPCHADLLLQIANAPVSP